MSTSPTIPMISPDGTIGDIPITQMQAASDKGFQVGKEVQLDGQKGVIPFSRYGDFVKQHGPITGPQAAPQDDSPHGFLQSLVAPIPQAARSIVHSFTDAPRSAEEQAAKGTAPDSGIVASLLGQAGLGVKRLAVDPTVNALKQTADDAKRGEYGGATFDALKSIPVLGQLLGVGEQAGTQAAGGDKLGALGTVAGNILPAVAMEATRAGMPKPGINPVSSTEMGARGIAQAINPAGPAMQSLVDAVQTHGGDLLKYIKDKGLRVTGALGYSKAARMAADDAYQAYRAQADPIADQLQRVPQGSGVNMTTNPANPSMPHATLADIEKRIGDINDLTYKAKTGEVTLESERRMALEAEHGQLADTLHNSVAKYVGGDITPDDVAALRQKFGKLGTIADVTQDAYSRRMGIEASVNQGTRFGHGLGSVGGAAMEVANRMVRGPVNAIADSALRSAVRASDLPTSGLKLTADTIPQGTRAVSALRKASSGR